MLLLACSVLLLVALPGIHSLPSTVDGKDISQRSIGTSKTSITMQWTMIFYYYCSCLAACIDEVIVMTFTSDRNDAESTDNFDLELEVNGDTYIAEFGTTTKDGGQLWKFAISDFHNIPSCVTKQDIEEIAIEEDTDDAWNIQSVLTVLRAGGDYELATMDMDVFQWVDGDNTFSNDVRHFELNLLI